MFPSGAIGDAVETHPVCCVSTLLPLFRSQAGEAQTPHPSWLPTMHLKSIPDPPGEGARSAAVLTIRSRLQRQGDGSPGPICLCGISPALQPLGVGLAAHSSTSGCAGGLERAGSGQRMRHSASPRPTLPAELLLRSSQNLKPPSPAGSCAAPLPPSRTVPQHPAAAASPDTEGRSLKPRLVQCRWEDDERAQKAPAGCHSACVCARTYPGRRGAAPVGMPWQRRSLQASFRMESRPSRRFFSWEETALVAISFQIALFPGSQMFPCSS